MPKFNGEVMLACMARWPSLDPWLLPNILLRLMEVLVSGILKEIKMDEGFSANHY